MELNKPGRPASGDSMTDSIFVRVGKETKAKLNECTQALNATRSDVVLKGIVLVHNSL